MAIIRKHEPVLDGIRGIAIILVLLAHSVWVFRQNNLTSWFLPAMTFGWCGVDLFFVLSGYLITGILIRSRLALNRSSSFYMRRFLRIFPIYYLCLSVILLTAPHWPWLRSALPYYRISDRIAYFAYLQNWLPLRHSGQTSSNILGHFWSLAVEEQFYLLWPWIVWNVSETRLLRLCIWGTLGSLLLSSLLVWHFGPQFWIDLLTPTRGIGLLVGSGVAAFFSRHTRLPGRVLVSMAAVGLMVLAWIALVDPREFTDTNAGPYMYTIGVAGLALIFGSLVGSSQRFIPFLTPVLNAPWLRSFGKYSYGLYVYHLPLFFICDYIRTFVLGMPSPIRTRYAFLYVAITIAMAFGVAWLSYNFFEHRFLRLKRRFDPVYEVPLVAAAAGA